MPNMQPFVDSNPFFADPVVLRSQMDKDGYLFLPGLLEPAAVAEVHDAILAICQEQGWADADGNPQGTPVLEGEEKFWDVYDPLQKLELFHGLAHHPQLLNVIKKLTQDAPLVHPRNISRVVPPQTEHFTTPPHQDHIHIQGTPETYTAWFPLSDCPQSMGSLVVLAQSHKQELLPVHQANGAGGLGVSASDDDPHWRGGNFRAGDVLLFHSHTVHKALPNLSNNLRISVDYRYQGASQPIVADGLLPHYNRLSWDEIYEGWTQPELQYYWRDVSLNVVARDPKLRERKLATDSGSR